MDYSQTKVCISRHLFPLRTRIRRVMKKRLNVTIMMILASVWLKYDSQRRGRDCDTDCINQVGRVDGDSNQGRMNQRRSKKKNTKSLYFSWSVTKKKRSFACIAIKLTAKERDLSRWKRLLPFVARSAVCVHWADAVLLNKALTMALMINERTKHWRDFVAEQKLTLDRTSIDFVVSVAIRGMRSFLTPRLRFPPPKAFLKYIS